VPLAASASASAVGVLVRSFYTIAAEGVTSSSKTSWSGPAVSSEEKTLKFKAYALNEKVDLPAVRAVLCCAVLCCAVLCCAVLCLRFLGSSARLLAPRSTYGSLATAIASLSCKLPQPSTQPRSR
jgi:hypothetical protein